MSELLIVKNISREGPGLLEEVLRDENIAFDVVDLDSGDTFPNPSDYRALVVLGGPDSANDKSEKMTAELSQIGVALDQHIPYLGICLGLQTLIKAAGGKVIKGAVKEAGFIDPGGSQFTVQVTETGKTDPLLVGLSTDLDVFQLHGETVELTESMNVLATGKFC